MAVTGATALGRIEQLRGQAWYGTLVQRAPAIVAFLLALLVAWQLARLVWTLFPGRADAPIAPPLASTPTVSEATTGGTGVNVRPIIDAHVFGIARAEDEPQGDLPPTTDAPETTLPLELRGTLATDSEDNALAIIADGREEKLYKIGDTIRAGVTLRSVEREQVILNRNGIAESLKLPRPEETASSPTVRRAQPTIRRATNSPSVAQRLTENAAQLTQIISPRPYYVGGQQRGYRLYPGTDRQKFAKLGLRPGDVVTAINGTPLNNPTQGARIFSSLGDAQSVTLTLERGGQEQTMTIDTTALDFDDQDSQ